MQVNLVHHTPLNSSILAIRKCWRSEDKSDSDIRNDSRNARIGEGDKKLVSRIIAHEHTSTLEHTVFNFEILGVSRALLQELARHRIASLSVESSRYCLKRIVKDELRIGDVCFQTGCPEVDRLNEETMASIVKLMSEQPSITNDVLKYALPEAFFTSLCWTVNLRSLRNFLKLRTSKRALKEIRDLAFAVYGALPFNIRPFVDDVMCREHDE